MSTRIKICGVCTVEDAVRAADLGCDALGLNFYPPSKRYVSTATAQSILRALPPFVESVGVFVDVGLQEIEGAVRSLCGLRYIQRYGDFADGPLPSSLRFVPALPIRDAESLPFIVKYLERCRELGQQAAAVLVDADTPGQHGGTGKQVPWTILSDVDFGVPLILAGGLTPDNVAEAIRIVRPYAVDVASGVESSPGRKDAEKMKRFIENARAAV